VVELKKNWGKNLSLKKITVGFKVISKWVMLICIIKLCLLQFMSTSPGGSTYMHLSYPPPITASVLPALQTVALQVGIPALCMQTVAAYSYSSLCETHIGELRSIACHRWSNRLPPNTCEQWLLSPKSGIKIGRNPPPQFLSWGPPISDYSFPLRFGLLFLLGRNFY